MSSDQQPASASEPREKSGNQVPPPKRVMATWWKVWIVGTLLFTLAMVAFELPNEVARWKLASAIKSWTAGNQTEALATLEEARTWSPSDLTIIMQRAAWMVEKKEYENALADMNLVIERAGPLTPLLRERSRVLQFLGRHQEAVDDWTELFRRSTATGEPAPVEALNGLAYAQALGKIDLEMALGHANDALDREPKNEAVLDTRGFIHYLMDDYKSAKSDLDRAIVLMEELITKLAANEEENAVRVRDPASLKRLQQQRNESLAVLYYHRSLVHGALKDETARAADHARAKELAGREPDESLF